MPPEPRLRSAEREPAARQTGRHAPIGAALGLPLGILLDALATRALSTHEIAFAIPLPEIIAFTIVALVAILAVLGVIVPARRASRLDVLDALHYE